MKNGANTPLGPITPADPIAAALVAALRPIVVEAVAVAVEQLREPAKTALWDTTEVAQYLSVSTRQIQNLRERAGLPCRRVGDVFRFDKAEVDQWSRERARGIGGAG